MLAEIPAHIYWEWIAYAEIDPFTRDREDLRAGIITANIVNALRVKGKRYKPKDFMPRYGRRRQTWQEQLKIVEALNEAFGGDDLRDNRGAQQD